MKNIFLSIIVLLSGVMIYVFFESYEGINYSSNLQLLIYRSAFILPTFLVSSVVGVIVALVSKKLNWGMVSAGILASILHLGASGTNENLGLSTYLVHVATVVYVTYLFSNNFLRKHNTQNDKD